MSSPGSNTHIETPAPLVSDIFNNVSFHSSPMRGCCIKSFASGTFVWQIRCWTAAYFVFNWIEVMAVRRQRALQFWSGCRDWCTDCSDKHSMWKW